MAVRHCSRSGCSAKAVVTMTFAYEDSTAILGPLAVQNTAGAYDLCSIHAARTSAPQGWQMVRLPMGEENEQIDEDDLLTLANAVREAGLGYELADEDHSENSQLSENGKPRLRLVPKK